MGCIAVFYELHHLHVIKLIYTMHDMLTIQYYLDLENYAESTEKAKNYMMEQVVLCLSNNYFINIILNQPGYYQLRYVRAVDVIK